MSDAKYHLHRDYRSCARLNLQHMLVCRSIPYLVHPAVKLTATARIADIGTGTGAWLFDLGRQLPTTVTLHGFDVDLRQCPHPDWCPENIQMKQWDVYDPLPAGVDAQYDLVHLRGCLQMVRDQDPLPMIKQLRRLVKPGGWIQWLDQDISQLSIAKAADDIPDAGTKQLLERLRGAFTHHAGEHPGWFSQMASTFEQADLKEIKVERFSHHRADLPNYHDNLLLSAEGLSSFAEDGEEFRRIVDQASAEFEQSKRGIAITVLPIMFLGRVLE